MARRPRSPNPIRPRRKDGRLYERALRDAYLDPLFRRLISRLATAAAADQAYRQIDDEVGKLLAEPRAGIPVDEIQRNLNRMERWHEDRLIKTFRSAMGVNVKPLLVDVPVRVFMEQKVKENVDLVRTIPTRAHDGLRQRIRELLRERPFDQEVLQNALRGEYRSSGYNLRRLTRDQTSKMTGQLTQMRHQQLGVEYYRWLTSQDERVRATHRDNSGHIFNWGEPPPDTGHPGNDVQCRCTASAVVSAQVMANWPLAA